MILSILPSVFSVVLTLLSISFIMSVGLAVYTFRMKDNKTAFLFGLIMILVICWTLLKISCLFIFSTEIRVILHYINIILVLPLPPLFLIIAVYYTKYPKWFEFRHSVALFIVPAIIAALVLTSPFHQLILYDFEIKVQYSIPMHFYKMNIGYYIFNFYNYLLMLGSLIILVKSTINKDIYFRRQLFLFTIGGMMPLIYDVFYTIGISPLRHYNMTSLFISLGNVFFAWSLFGYRFFKLVPITRHVVVEKMADMMIVTNDDNLIIDINESCKSFFNVAKKHLIGVSFFEIFKNYPNLIRKYFDKHNSIREITLHNQGRDYYFSISISPVESGNVLLANIIILHDITARINNEFEIKQLSIAVEQSPVSIITTDLEGKIEYVNAAFYETTGLLPIESINNNTRILKGKTNPEIYKELWSTILSGQIWKGEFINKKQNGEFYYAETTIAPIKNDKNKTVKFIAIMNDITSRKEAELKIQEQNRELTELNATKDKFFSIIAHDLKNPFNSILGMTYLLVNYYESYEQDKVKQIIEHIDHTANQTYKLLENLLEWSKIQQGKLRPNLQKHNLKKIASETIQLHSDSARIKNIKVDNKIIEHTYILCDLEMTKTVMRNLISNAIKFTNKNGKIHVFASQNEEYVEIHIKDNGVGISPKNLDTIFSIEKNSSTPGTENEKGSGLGLILCKEMVEQQGGKIWIESEVDKGTKIALTLKTFKSNYTN